MKSCSRRTRRVGSSSGLKVRLHDDSIGNCPSQAVDARLRRNAYEWGRQLRSAGIDANLAPVADVVPTAMVWMNQPIGQLRRGYGPHRRPQK